MDASRGWIALGALAGLGAVAAAAYAAHAQVEPARLRALSSAVQMQGWHALALIACGLWAAFGGWWPVHVAGGAFTVGMLLFCGAVYVPLFGGPNLGMTAPVGGTLLMLGWAALGVSALGTSAPMR